MNHKTITVPPAQTAWWETFTAWRARHHLTHKAAS